MKKVNSFYGFSMFNDVEDSRLRAHNRLQTVRNLKELGKVEMATSYLDQFSSVDRTYILTMVLDMSIRGEEVVKAEISRGMQ